MANAPDNTVTSDQVAQNTALITAALYLQMSTDWSFQRAHDFMVIHYMAAKLQEERLLLRPGDESRPATGPHDQTPGMPGTRTE